MFVSADNPMLCELCSHIGLKGNFFSPRCLVGGTQAEKATDEGFDALFHVNVNSLP